MRMASGMINTLPVWNTPDYPHYNRTLRVKWLKSANTGEES